jgi:hypothetical protein
VFAATSRLMSAMSARMARRCSRSRAFGVSTHGRGHRRVLRRTWRGWRRVSTAFQAAERTRHQAAKLEPHRPRLPPTRSCRSCAPRRWSAMRSRPYVSRQPARDTCSVRAMATVATSKHKLALHVKAANRHTHYWLHTRRCARTLRRWPDRVPARLGTDGCGDCRRRRAGTPPRAALVRSTAWHQRKRRCLHALTTVTSRQIHPSCGWIF